jgi:hypothetical protein
MTEEKKSLWESAKEMGKDALEKVEDVGDKLNGGDDSQSS